MNLENHYLVLYTAFLLLSTFLVPTFYVCVETKINQTLAFCLTIFILQPIRRQI